MPAAKLTDLIGEIKYEKAHHDLWQAVDDKCRVPQLRVGYRVTFH
jgi:hypothetical protein